MGRTGPGRHMEWLTLGGRPPSEAGQLQEKAMGRPVAFRAAAIMGYPGEVHNHVSGPRRCRWQSGDSAQTFSHHM